jgi:hypothetical protein
MMPANHGCGKHLTRSIAMNADELKAAWIAALRSGEYKQGKHCLVNQIGEFCCLGVLEHICETNGIKLDLDGSNSMLRTEFGEDVLVSRRVQSRLASMNDDDKCSFSVIADYIQKHVKITLPNS